MKVVEVENDWNWPGGEAVENMAGSQLLERCERLPSSPESSADTRKHVFVGETSSNNTWQLRSRSRQSRWGFPELGTGTYVRSTGVEVKG